jgi:hypothetical protein
LNLIQIKTEARLDALRPMAAFIFICPETSMNVQHWLSDDPLTDENQYEAVTCPACAKLHFINRKTRKLFGQDEE